jgi:hypothetical protein
MEQMCSIQKRGVLWYELKIRLYYCLHFYSVKSSAVAGKTRPWSALTKY